MSVAYNSALTVPLFLTIGLPIFNHGGKRRPWGLYGKGGLNGDADTLRPSVRNEPFSSFQIADKSHVSVIPRSLFPDPKDGRGMIGRERITPTIDTN